MKDFWKKQRQNWTITFLSPMDWYTDSAYRQVNKKVNPNIICVSEFYSADWLVNSKFLAWAVLPHKQTEKPLIIQIFWKEPENFAKAAKIIERYDVAWIDINMWCPVKKVVKSWHGSGLIINRDTAFEIVEAINKATHLPISVKTRLGWNGAETLIEFVKWLENAWASLITVHGRTAAQAYTWFADFTQIYELKKHVSIPVICNWDIKNYVDGMKKIQNLDWIMIWRWSFWNPWCFLKDGQSELESGEKLNWKYVDWHYFATLGEIIEMMRFHAIALVENKWERKWTLDIRKHLVQYLKSFPWVSAYRKRLVTVESLENLLWILDEIESEFGNYLNMIPSEIEII
jgi:tRNA-dihydrouridine synthase B